MTSWRRAILLGLLVWLAPFVVACGVFPFKESWRALFESIMAVSVAAAAVACTLWYLRPLPAASLREGALLGILWLAMCIAIDLPLMLNAPMNYALPEYANEPQRVSAISADDIQTGVPSEEAARESRRLKVGHTMVGIQFALPDAGATPLSPAAAPHDAPPFGGQDEPVSIPVDGLPPALVGALVLLAMAAVAVTGFWLLR